MQRVMIKISKDAKTVELIVAPQKDGEPGNGVRVDEVGQLILIDEKLNYRIVHGGEQLRQDNETNR